MGFGVHIMLTAETIGPAELAKGLEDRGFDALWLAEHTHIPVSRRTPYPPGTDLPEEYKRCLDPLVALAVAAGATSRLVLGTGVIQAALREPIVTAKAIATLDVLCGGRLALGVGFGWNKEEIADHGVEFSRRRDVAREHVRAMQTLWEHDEAEFAGEFVNFSRSWSWPKPVQRDALGHRGVPVLFGGAAGPKLFDQIIEYGSGWMPLAGPGLGENVPKLRELADRAGRDPDGISIMPFGTTANHGKFDYFESLGISSVILNLPSEGRDEVLRELDVLAEFVAERRA